MARRRPPGWTPPGPVPPGDGGDPSLLPGPGETLDCLCGHWKLFQLARGHRYSTDDLITAWYAAALCRRRGREPQRLLDLGCGIGSVGLMLLWRFPALAMVGVEAQAQSAALARRSLRYNGAGHRAEIVEGDLREFSRKEVFDLVTGSPPYLHPLEGRRSERPQRGPCRFEDRGGVSGYLDAAARHLAPGGLVVWVHATRYDEENERAAREAGFASLRRKPVIFRRGRPSLITLYGATREAGATLAEEPLEIRDREGAHTDEARALRAEMGFPAGRMSSGAKVR